MEISMNWMRGLGALCWSSIMMIVFLNSVGAMPSPPTGLSALHVTPTSIRVCWTKPTRFSDRAGGYIIYYQGEGQQEQVVEVPSGSASDWQISEVNGNITYTVSTVSRSRYGVLSSRTGPVVAARGPGIAFLGSLLSNNSLISRNRIGTDYRAVYCIVDDDNFCTGSLRGNWSFPGASNTLVSEGSTNSTYFAISLAAAVLLNYENDSSDSGDSGIFSCRILDKDNDTHTLFIGVYPEFEGIPVIVGPIQISLQSAVVVLTCTSVGGPTTNVTWTQNDHVIDENSDYVFSQRIVNTETAEYVNALTITRASAAGNYQCSVSNERGRDTSQMLPLTAPKEPTILSAIYEAPNSVHVYWHQPSSPTSVEITGYEIILSKNNKTDLESEYIVPVSGNTTDNYLISMNQDTLFDYNYIYIRSVSEYINSSRVGPVRYAKGPGVMHKGEMVSNNSIVDNIVGIDTRAVYCVIDDANCCGTPDASNGRGDWNFPSGDPVFSSTANNNAWYSSWTSGAILLNCRYSNGTSGIFRCLIRDRYDHLHSYYVGIYHENKGHPLISQPIKFDLQSILYPLVFTLTCISTGGPATTVTWTRSGAVVADDYNHTYTQTIVNTETAEYANTLTVTGREEREGTGDYQCTVSNVRGSATSRIFSLNDTYPPTEFEVTQFYGTITVSWTEPYYRHYGATPTGYMIFYKADDDQGSVLINGSTVNHTEIDAQSEYAYTIEMVTLSDDGLPSSSVGPVRIDIVDLEAYPSSATEISLWWRYLPGRSTNYLQIVYTLTVGDTILDTFSRNTYGNSMYMDASVTVGEQDVLRYQYKFQVVYEQKYKSMVTRYTKVGFEQTYFQLRIGPLEHCGSWDLAKGAEMEQVIREEVGQVINRECGCYFHSSFMRVGKLSCRNTFNQVTYRGAVVLPIHPYYYFSMNSTELVGVIEDWVDSRRAILYAGPFILDVDASCDVAMSSFNAAECEGADEANALYIAQQLLETIASLKDN